MGMIRDIAGAVIGGITGGAAGAAAGFTGQSGGGGALRKKKRSGASIGDMDLTPATDESPDSGTDDPNRVMRSTGKRSNGKNRY